MKQAQGINLRCIFLCLASCWLICTAQATEHSQKKIKWLHSDVEAFEIAKKQHRYVLPYLEAVWCHWCHVMDERSYGNDQVAAEIAAHYIPLRIDQDLRPDLANRYRDYGWPATVVFANNGSEIVKRQGFIEPERFLRLLQHIVDNPTPETTADTDKANAVEPSTSLDNATRQELLRRHQDSYDHELGGLNTEQKYLERDSVEYALARAANGDADALTMARQTLDAAATLIDPVWGGVYQYSTYGDWKHPHFEKLAIIQAQYLRIYALAFAAYGRTSDRLAIESIRGYLNNFLRTPEGVFRVSQDADLKPGQHAEEYFRLNDAERRALGVPRVDPHVYAASNGEIIEALATWAELSGDVGALADAETAANWIIKKRQLNAGGFSHDEHDAAGPYLTDTLAMGRAFLALYRATANRTWLTRASQAADFIEHNFHVAFGYASARSRGPIPATVQIDENISLTRFANLLARYSGKSSHQEMARHGLRYLSNPKIALERLTEAGILLADDEIHRDPLHVVTVGPKADKDAKLLFLTLQHLPTWYKRVEWWDRSEGPLPNPDINYPQLKRAAAFVCTETRCSLPMFQPEQIMQFLTPPTDQIE